MTAHLLADMDGVLADRAIEGERPLDGVGRGPRALHHLDQRDEMRRIEGMAEDAALDAGGAIASG